MRPTCQDGPANGHSARLGLWQRLLGLLMSEFGTLCRGDGGHEGQPLPEGGSVDFYEAAGHVTLVMRSLLSDLEICVIHGWPVTVGRISRGSVGLVFMLIKGESSELAGARGDSRGGDAIYSAAVRQ
jgi:hypothetical protein